MKKWVVISCTPDPVYDFFLPIAVRLWRKRIGYEPAVFLIGSDKDWSSGHAKVVYDEIKDLERVRFFSKINGIPDAATSLALRQHVSALEDFDPDDLILVGDVDLFPVDRDFYHQYDPTKNPVGVYYADMYAEQYFPAYGVSMPVRNWREVMGIEVGDFLGSVARVFTDENVKAVGLAEKVGTWDTRFWTFDERFASWKIRNSRFTEHVAKFPEIFRGKRPHRVKLPREPYVGDYVDFHCSRPGWTEENWPDIRFALAQMMPDDLRWLDGYVEKYLSSLEEKRDEPPASLEAVYLPWDSDAFKKNVGLLKVKGQALPRPFAIAQANKGKVDVVFVKADGWHEPHGVFGLDYTYEMEYKGYASSSDDPVVECRPPSPAHIALAREAFRGSRFYRDPFLFGKAGDFYEKWLHGEGIVYALEKNVDAAFLFVSVDPDRAGRISLIAVEEKSRGASIGGDLVYGVMNRRRDLEQWRVRVNARNVQAIRFYEGFGFRIKSVQTAFHVWASHKETL